jgi:cysteinyl-tRNA synthetase
MSLELLGEGFDLHCGGADLRFPHHENERAQAVALGKRFARHWMHNGFVVDLDGEKMSKSLGNVTNLLDLLDQFDARAYRVLLLQTHYRSPVRVGRDNLDASVKALAGLDAFAARSASLGNTTAHADVLAQFRTTMDNDLDTPNALALIFDTVRRANTAIDTSDPGAAALAAAIHEMCAALGLTLGSHDTVDDAELSRAREKAAALDAARAAKDFSKADALRAELQGAGWLVETTKQGTTLRRA